MMKKIDFQKYMHHQLTEEETRQLYEWLCESKENQQAWFSLKEAWLHQEYEKEKLEADTQNEWKNSQTGQASAHRLPADGVSGQHGFMRPPFSFAWLSDGKRKDYSRLRQNPTQSS